MADISFGIGGENGAFLTALAQCKAAATEASESISHSFEAVTGAFEKVSAVLAVFTAALAGGAAFKEAIDATVELATGAAALGRQFGIGATAASELRVAMDDVHVSTDMLSTAGNALIKTLNTNEEAFKSIGVATRDSSGAYRNQLDILLDVTDHLARLKEGTDRNIEGQRLFGKAWAEVAPVVKLTSEGMREAAEKAEALGLAVGAEQLTAVTRYRAAVNDVGDVMTGLKNAIGQAVMPALTAMGEWFGSIGPGLVEGFRIAMSLLTVPFREVALAVRVFYETVKAVFQQLGTYLDTFAATFNKALHGDFAGASASWRDGMIKIQQIGSDYWNKIAADAKATQDKIAGSFAESIVGPQVTPTPPSGGTQTSPVDKDRLARWQTELEEMKASLTAQGAAIGEFHEFTKQQEIAYWQNILDTQKLSTTESLEIRRKIAAAQVALGQQQLQAELGQLQTAEAAQANNLAAKLAIAQAYAERVKTAYGADSKEYAAAQKEIIQIELEKQQQLVQLNQIALTSDEQRQLAAIDQAERHAQTEVSLHKMTQDELLEQERQFENQRHQIQLQSLQKQLAVIDPDRDPVKYAQVNAQIEALETQHQTKLVQIIDQKQITAAQEFKQRWGAAFDTMENSFSSAVLNMVKNGQTFGQAMRGMFASIAEAAIQTATKNIAAMAMESLASNSIRSAEIKKDAGAAAAAAYKAVVGIPYIGPFLAPAAAAVAYAGVLAFDSAEGGYDIPAGMNPVVQTHQREMILPEKYADVIRGLAGNKGRGNFNLHVSPAGNGHYLITKDNLAAHIRELGFQFKLPR